MKMQKLIARPLAVLCLLTIAASASFAQSPGSAEWYVKYGREYYEAGDYDKAAMYFKQGIGTYQKNAQLQFYLGQAYAAMGKKEEARSALQKAVDLDASLKPSVDKVLSGEEQAPRNQGAEQPMKSRTGSAPFKTGDEVDVKDHASGNWVRGKVMSVEDISGNGTRFAYKVRYRGVADWVENRFYPDSIRAASAATRAADKEAAAKPGYGGGLAFGDYACTQDYFAGGVGNYQRRSDPKGTLSMKADGAYQFRGSSGRYNYEQATGEIKWLSGYLASDKNTSKYKRNQRTTQIDITFHTGSGDLYWSCGRNN